MQHSWWAQIDGEVLRSIQKYWVFSTKNLHWWRTHGRTTKFRLSWKIYLYQCFVHATLGLDLSLPEGCSADSATKLSFKEISISLAIWASTSSSCSMLAAPKALSNRPWTAIHAFNLKMPFRNFLRMLTTENKNNYFYSSVINVVLLSKPRIAWALAPYRGLRFSPSRTSH